MYVHDRHDNTNRFSIVFYCASPPREYSDFDEIVVPLLNTESAISMLTFFLTEALPLRKEDTPKPHSK